MEIRKWFTGLVTNNRPSIEDGDKILGCFLNTIPLRYIIDYNLTVKDFIKEIKQKITTLKKYERLSLLQIAAINKREYIKENPFFDAYFNYVDFYSYDVIKEEDHKEEKQPSEEGLSLLGSSKTNTFLDFNVNTNREYLSCKSFIN